MVTCARVIACSCVILLWWIFNSDSLLQQDHSLWKTDRRRRFPGRWPWTPCGCASSSRWRSPRASCGTASSSTSTAVYSECADEARVFLIGPLEKSLRIGRCVAQRHTCSSFTSTFSPPPLRWMNVHLQQWRETRNRKRKHRKYTDYRCRRRNWSQA